MIRSALALGPIRLFNCIWLNLKFWKKNLFKNCRKNIYLQKRPEAVFLVVIFVWVKLQSLEVRGHSNNTWHFLGAFLTPPPSCVIFLFYITDTWSKLSQNIKWNRKKVSFEALSCPETKIFTSFGIKNRGLKSKKSVCDLSATPPPPSECHVLFEWPLILPDFLL